MATRLSNRIRGLLTGIHPALERALGSDITHRAVLEILAQCGGPAGIRDTEADTITAIAKKHAPRKHTKLVAVITAALDEQTVTVPGSSAADTVLPPARREPQNRSRATENPEETGGGDP